MIRAIIAILIGLLAWAVSATGLDILLRHVLTGYAAAEPQMQFTLPMMFARLALPGGIPSIIAGIVGAWISRKNGRVTFALAIVLLLVFLPAHYQLRTKFPLWYHVTFLGSLIVLPWLGAKLYAYLDSQRVKTHSPVTATEVTRSRPL
jgi:hypothetical protein